MQLPFKITGIHSRNVPFGYSASLHTHQIYQWYYVHEGEMKYKADENEWLLKNGDSVLMCPGVLRELFNIGKAINYVVINFEISEIYIPKFRTQMIHLGPNLRSEAEILIREIRNPGFVYSNIFIHAMLTRIMLELFREIESSNSREESPSRKKSELVEAIDNYLFLNFPNPISREDISRYCGFSSVHAARVFKEITGKTIVERLTELRLQAAEKILIASDLPITEISLSVGFNSFSHFTQLFKKNVGESPSEYRNKARK